MVSAALSGELEGCRYEPVSYTHLDVYKRQALLIAEMFMPGFGLFGALGIITLIASIVHVSYTHLDVYKRQVPVSIAVDRPPGVCLFFLIDCHD